MKKGSIDMVDVFYFAGLLLLTAGVYFVWPPLALIVPGVILMTPGALMILRGRGGGN